MICIWVMISICGTKRVDSSTELVWGVAEDGRFACIAEDSNVLFPLHRGRSAEELQKVMEDTQKKLSGRRHHETIHLNKHHVLHPYSICSRGACSLFRHHRKTLHRLTDMISPWVGILSMRICRYFACVRCLGVVVGDSLQRNLSLFCVGALPWAFCRYFAWVRCLGLVAGDSVQQNLALFWVGALSWVVCWGFCAA